jgi:methionine-S-sulfoxide reductase
VAEVAAEPHRPTNIHWSATVPKRLMAISIMLSLATLVVGQDTRPDQDLALATFASGCFWCTEADFEKVPGVVEAVSGYTGGDLADPSYEQVSAGGTGHVEAVQLHYDPAVVSYSRLLEVYWRNVDPLDDEGQFCDRGDSYRSAIFYHTPEQRREAEASRRELAESGRFHAPVVAEISAAGVFYPAESYHQDYYRTHSLAYSFYRWRCGRDQRLEELWAGTS